MILALVYEAVADGARQSEACKILGVSARMVQRWRASQQLDDQRKGPKTEPKNKLSAEEKAEIMQLVNKPEFRDLAPSQIVPILADRGIYRCSEATLYRLLREAKQNNRRQSNKRRKVKPLTATGPNEVWSWDITYLRCPIRGQYYYLYLIMDVWSRKIVGWSIENCESAEHASDLVKKLCRQLSIPPDTLTIHSDNGSPMKGATMLATLEKLGVATSFSRPRVSNDNPYSESLFGTMKGRPAYPSDPFKSIEDARIWVAGFVHWYNHLHLHSALKFVTPEDRHTGREKQILQNRDKVYQKARKDHPERWSGTTRNWTLVKEVKLNPGKNTSVKNSEKKEAA